MKKVTKTAEELHENVPSDWYYRSIKENALQRYWHNKRFEEIAKLTEPVPGEVLDVGCADGVFTKVILENTKARKIIGVDVLESSINWAKKHWRTNKRMKFLVADVHKLPFNNNTFDAVFSLEMLEHIYKPRNALKEIKRVMKRGGYGIFLVPSESNLFKIVWFLWHFSGRMVWKDTHIQTYRNDRLVYACQKVGLKVVESKKFNLGMLHAVKVKKK